MQEIIFFLFKPISFVILHIEILGYDYWKKKKALRDISYFMSFYDQIFL